MIEALRDKQAVLKARAQVLAREIEAAATTENLVELLEFHLGQERYAIERTYVREIHSLKDLTPLPCTPEFVLGIINVRGQILTVIDIKKCFDLPDTAPAGARTVIIVHDNDAELGILADAVTGVFTVHPDMIQQALPTLTGIRAEYLKGVTNEQVAIVDVCKILAEPKIFMNEQVQG